MKLIQVDLKELEEVHIHILGDMHIGSMKFNLNAFKKRVELIKTDPNARAIVLGDLINNSIKSSVGDCYAEPLSPMEQINIAKSLLLPIKDKIICIVAGNHERRTYKTDGIDLTYFLATELGIADKYDYVSGCLIVRWGQSNGKAKNVTTMYCTHGDGNGGKTIGGKANGMSKRGAIIDADIIITGHTHTPVVFAESTFKIDERHNHIQQTEQLFVNCGSNLGYEDYAEIYGMRPSSTSNPVIHLTSEKVTATL